MFSDHSRRVEFRSVTGGSAGELFQAGRRQSRCNELVDAGPEFGGEDGCLSDNRAGGAFVLLSSAKHEVVLVTRADAPDSVVSVAAIAARPERFERLWGNTAMTFWRVRRPS